MKERFRDIGEIFKNTLNPFGATIVKPWVGTEVDYEKIKKGTPYSEPRKTEEGKVVVPSGSSARLIFRRKGEKIIYRIDDWRGREGHSPGADVSGEFGDFELDENSSKKEIVGVGVFTYKEK